MHWNPLIEKIQKSLAGWKGKLLSLRGRVTMINALLLAILTWYLSFYSLTWWV